ncbi:hypothetical protein SY85_15375 [Flavisolibacter tropicus]|uniref:Uncharacterized protein n=1 Tax=Flavisolibacter tropicus TaxID=1492898 RepID=A0A172TXE4_9BACT|nr:hypothetical protein SY85_15375 [Flavisolibacter tropicus]
MALIGITILLTFASSCKKDNHTSPDCLPDTPTYRQVNNRSATIISASGEFYILEQGTIDTKLKPCNLPNEFQVNNLQVTISGNVKQTTQGNSQPCCIENFVITRITR